MSSMINLNVISKIWWGPVKKGQVFIFNINHNRYQSASTDAHQEPDICLSVDIVHNNEQVFEPLTRPEGKNHD